MARAGNPWRWTGSANGDKYMLIDGRGRERATVWRNDDTRFTWHTWDDRGTGGENSECSSLRDAKDQCVAALVRQGWAPGGWKVVWPTPTTANRRGGE